MNDKRTPLRLYQAEGDSPRRDAHLLAAQELLRPVPSRPSQRDLPPFSRAWFETLELKRYSDRGQWLPRFLEFSRHAGDNLLMIGPGLGSDALQFQRHGVEVTILAQPSDPVELIHANFQHRGLKCDLRHGERCQALPFADNAFDLAYVNLIYGLEVDLPELVSEVYRILKPGGKVFVLAPAKYDVYFWQSLLMPYRRWYREVEPLSDAPRYSTWQLKQLFPKFSDARWSKRHLRGSDLPHLWRIVPLAILERLIGRVVGLRAFKPLSAALEGLPVATPPTPKARTA